MSKLYRNRRARLALTAAVLFAGYSHHAQGTTFNISWDGPASGLWGTASNWTTNVVPGNNVLFSDFYNVTINRVGGVTVTGDISPTILNLTIGTNLGNQLIIGDTEQLGLIGVFGGGAASLSNSGTLSLGSTVASTATLLLNGTSTSISGSGTINMLGDCVISGQGTVTSSNTIIGRGNLGNDSFAFINNGTVSASGGSLTVDARSSGGLINNNLMQALPGGTLVLSGNGGGTIFNTSGSIASNGASGNNGRVQLVNGVTIVSGTLDTTGFGQFFMPSGNNGTFSGLTNNADVNINPNNTLSLLGTITNNNRIRVNSSSGIATFNMGLGTVTLAGTGSLVLGQIAGVFGNVVGTGTLINGASHTIAGIGTIGTGGLDIVNAGTISADNAVGSLALELGPADMTNTGTIESRNGGNLQIGNLGGGGVIANAGGTISAVSGLINMSEGITVSGGTFRSDPGSSIFVSSGSATVSGVTNLGELVVANGTLQLNGTINNSGTILMVRDASAATLSIGGSTTSLTGGGQVVMGDIGAGTSVIAGTGTFNNVNNTIAGWGTFGNNSIAIINGGTINSNDAAEALFIDPGPGGMINTGTVMVTNASGLELSGNGGGAINNSGGTIQTSTNAVIVLRNGISISGGTLTGSGGQFQLPGTHSATLSNLTQGAQSMVQLSSSTLNLVGTITNNGRILMLGNSPAVATISLGASTVTLNGTGEVIMGTAGGGITQIVGTGTLVNGPSHLIHGPGNLGNNTIAIINNGTIENSTGGTQLIIDPSPAGMTNSGTIAALTTGQIVLTGLGGGAINNSTGSILSSNNGLVRLENGVTISGGTFGGVVPSGIRVFGGHTANLSSFANLTQLLVDSSAASDGTINISGAISNSGTVSVRSSVGGSTVARLLLAGGTVSFSGAGGIDLNSSGNTSVLGGGGTLANGASHTIHGSGQLGNNGISIVNGGTISADPSVFALVVDPSAGLWTNSGTMNATGGGTLELTGANGGAQLGNTGGRIIAETASNVRLRGGLLVNGGTLSTVGTGTISVPNTGTSTIELLTNTGNIQVDNGGILTISTSLTNNGSISVNGSSSVTRLDSGSGTVTLSGTGTVLMTSALSQLTSGGTFENQTNTISGRGTMTGRIHNQSAGVIDANLPGAVLSVNESLNIFQNAGMVRATNGGIMELTNGLASQFINTGAGIMRAENGSTLRLSAAGVTGGTLTTLGTGTIDIDTASLVSTIVTGHTIVDSGTLTIGTLVTSTDRIDVSNAGTTLRLSSTGSSTFQNTGTVTFDPSTLTELQVTGSGTIINSGTMTGFARFRPSSGGALVINNSGLIEGTAEGISFYHFTDLSGDPVTVNNSGVLRAGAGGFSMEVGGATTVNGLGTIDVRPGGTFASNGNVSTGTTTVDGELQDFGISTLGRVSGAGTLSVGGFNPGVGIDAGNTTATHVRAGRANVLIGTLTTSAGGGTLGTSRVSSLSVGAVGAARWNLTDHDLVIDYTGASPLSTIQGLLTTGYAAGAWTGNGLTSSSAAASPSSAKTALGYAEASDMFTSFPASFSGQSIDSTSVLIKYTLSGDATLDGTVNGSDFNLLASNFGTSGTRWRFGDFTYDGNVNGADFNALATNFGQTLGSGSGSGPGATVPEPAVLGLAASAATLLMRRARRRCA